MIQNETPKETYERTLYKIQKLKDTTPKYRSFTKIRKNAKKVN